MGPNTLYFYPGGPVEPTDLALRSKYFRSPEADNQVIISSKETSIATSFSAAERVFSTIELLEQILEHCLFSDLLTRLPRVCTTWKTVIDTNKYIQQHLFFVPWNKGDYPDRWIQINPFIHYLAYQKGDNWFVGGMANWGPEPTKSVHEDDSDDSDADEAGWIPEWPVKEYFAFNWRRIERDSRFMYEKASWRRMSAIQPPKKTVWNVMGGKEEHWGVKWLRSIRERGKRLGKIHEDVLLFERKILCVI